MYLHKIIYDSETQSTTGTFRFHNENYFGVDWSDANVDLYWMPSSDTLLSSTCAVNGENPCVYLNSWKTQCAIKIGEFSDDSSFKTGSQEHTSRDMALTQTSQQSACLVNMAAVAIGKQVEQTLYSKGSIHAKGEYRNFHKIDIDGTYYY